MFKFKPTLFTATLSFCLLSIICTSHAFEIEELRPYDDVYDSTYYHIAYVKTSEAYDYINWYVDGNWKEVTFGDGDTLEATFCPSDLTGNVEGVAHHIQAYAHKIGNPTLSVTKSYNIRLFISSKDEGDGSNTGCWGSSVIDYVKWTEIPREGRRSNWEASGFQSMVIKNPSNEVKGGVFKFGNYVARIRDDGREADVEDEDVLQYLVGPTSEIIDKEVPANDSIRNTDSVFYTLQVDDGWLPGESFRVKMYNHVQAKNDNGKDEWARKEWSEITLSDDN